MRTGAGAGAEEALCEARLLSSPNHGLQTSGGQEARPHSERMEHSSHAPFVFSITPNGEDRLLWDETLFPHVLLKGEGLRRGRGGRVHTRL